MTQKGRGNIGRGKHRKSGKNPVNEAVKKALEREEQRRKAKKKREHRTYQKIKDLMENEK